MSWHVVDGRGCDAATGRPPEPPGWSSPAAALAGAPVVPWPLAVVGDDGRRLSVGEALGSGGDRVEDLLDGLAAGVVDVDDVEALARATPAGPVRLPLATVGLAAGAEAATRVDREWLAEVDRRRSAPRAALEAAGRDAEMEAALHVALLVAAERLDPVEDADVDAHVASGARGWLLAGAVVSALAGADPDHFAAWGRLVAGGWWPVGPSEGGLVLSPPAGAAG